MLTTRTVLLALALALDVAAHPAASGSRLPPHHPRHSAPPELLSRIQKSNPAALDHAAPSVRASTRSSSISSSALRVTPASFGGDPTGRKDSWEALNACLQHCLNQSAISPNGYFPGLGTTPMFGPIRDMGGCDVDLEGGEYLISKPLVLPEFNANMQFGRGSLVATPDFKGDFLFVIGVEGSCKYPQGSCNLDINFPELFLDGARVASGMQINNVMGVTIGPGGYFLNFTEYGLQINQGHEVMMERVWMGETNFDFDHEAMGAPPNATAVQINGNDHYILNSIIFSSRIGVEVNGAADYISGVHVWFPVNHAVHYANTAAFHVTKSGNRFNGCYIDGGRAIFTSAALGKNIWTNGFECCQNGPPAENTTASGITLVGTKIGDGFQIINNEFGGGKIYHISELWPSFYETSSSALFSEQNTVSRDCALDFNISADNHECIGLRESTSGSSSLDACAAACCHDAGCTVYQFCPEGGKCDGATGTAAQCWTGSFSKCDQSHRVGWKGMATAAAPELSVSGVRISHNSFSNGAVGTQATQSLTQKNATKWKFDFCDSLVFPQIALVRVNVQADEGFPRAVARTPQGCSVTIETDIPMSGTIVVDVDSSSPSSSFL